MSVREAVPILSSQGTIFAYPPVPGVPATITTPGANYSFTAGEARDLAQTLSPDLDPEEVKDAPTKPYMDKAAAALTELQETIDSYTRALNIARRGNVSAAETFVIADSMEDLLMALSESVVALKELAEGNV